MWTSCVPPTQEAAAPLDFADPLDVEVPAPDEPEPVVVDVLDPAAPDEESDEPADESEEELLESALPPLESAPPLPDADFGPLPLARESVL